MPLVGNPGCGRASSSVSSSVVELQAEKALSMGGRTGGMVMAFGASAGRLSGFVGDCGGDAGAKDRSGHERGERGMESLQSL